MGYMRHHALIVTTWDFEKAKAAFVEAVGFGNTCTDIHKSSINDYHTFVVLPDGSKEGWKHSEDGDMARAELIQWLHEQRLEDDSSHYSWAEIMYGDDEGELSIRGSR
jgi:hypothetical protein